MHQLPAEVAEVLTSQAEPHDSRFGAADADGDGLCLGESTVCLCMCCYHGSVHQIVLESVSVSVLPSATGAEDGILAPRHLITHRARSKAVARGV